MSSGMIGTCTDWWRRHQPDPSGKVPGDKGSFSRIRRCSTLGEIMEERSTILLFQQLGCTAAFQLPRVAVISGVLAHIREDTRTGNPAHIARLVGPASANEPETAILKPLRMRQVMEASTEEDKLMRFRRMAQLAGGKLPVADMAEAILFWSDKIRREWILNYWNAMSPAGQAGNAKTTETTKETAR